MLAESMVVLQVRWAVRVIEEQKPHTDNPGMILVLKSLAKNAPASFNVYINSFVSHIWKGLIGKDLQLRLLSSEAFRVSHGGREQLGKL